VSVPVNISPYTGAWWSKQVFCTHINLVF
jgi:hypothetical protein